jgi:hypothetical protein
MGKTMPQDWEVLHIADNGVTLLDWRHPDASVVLKRLRIPCSTVAAAV